MRDARVGQSAQAKLDRARFHLDELRREVSAGPVSPGPVAFRIDYDRQEVIVFTVPEEVSLRWAILAGEVIHQARSGLDHLMWELIERNAAVPVRGRTGFPVLSAKSKKREYRFEAMVDGIDERARNIIWDSQPGDSAHPLYVLNEMWNRDKHRTLNMAAFAVSTLVVLFRFPDGFRHEIFDIPRGALPVGVEVERRPLPFFLPREVEVMGEVDVLYQFTDDPARDEGVVELLKKLVDFTQGIVDQLIADP